MTGPTIESTSSLARLTKVPSWKQDHQLRAVILASISKTHRSLNPLQQSLDLSRTHASEEWQHLLHVGVSDSLVNIDTHLVDNIDQCPLEMDEQLLLGDL